MEHCTHGAWQIPTTSPICPRWGIQLIGALRLYIMDFFSYLQLFKHTVLNSTSLAGCRTLGPTAFSTCADAPSIGTKTLSLKPAAIWFALERLQAIRIFSPCFFHVFISTGTLESNLEILLVEPNRHCFILLRLYSTIKCWRSVGHNCIVLLDSFAPSLFPKLFLHNSRTPCENGI